MAKIFNRELTSAATFDKNAFEELLKKMQDFIPLVRSVENDVLLCELTKYSVYMRKNKVLQFKTHIANNEVYEALHLSVETVQTLLGVGQFFKNALEQCTIQRRVFPDYDNFIDAVAFEIMSNGGGDDRNFDQTILKMIEERYESSPILYEILLKMPQTLRYHIQNRIGYFREHNDYNCSLLGQV